MSEKEELQRELLIGINMFCEALDTDEERAKFFAVTRRGWCVDCGRTLTDGRPRCHCENDE